MEIQLRTRAAREGLVQICFKIYSSSTGYGLSVPVQEVYSRPLAWIDRIMRRALKEYEIRKVCSMTVLRQYLMWLTSEIDIMDLTVAADLSQLQQEEPSTFLFFQSAIRKQFCSLNTKFRKSLRKQECYFGEMLQEVMYCVLVNLPYNFHCTLAKNNVEKDNLNAKNLSEVMFISHVTVKARTNIHVIQKAN